MDINENTKFSELTEEEINNYILYRNKALNSQTQQKKVKTSSSSVTVDAPAGSTITVDVEEETDSEFFRRIRFNIKVEEFRKKPKKTKRFFSRLFNRKGRKK